MQHFWPNRTTVPQSIGPEKSLNGLMSVKIMEIIWCSLCSHQISTQLNIYERFDPGGKQYHKPYHQNTSMSLNSVFQCFQVGYQILGPTSSIAQIKSKHSCFLFLFFNIDSDDISKKDADIYAHIKLRHLALCWTDTVLLEAFTQLFLKSKCAKDTDHYNTQSIFIRDSI